MTCPLKWLQKKSPSIPQRIRPWNKKMKKEGAMFAIPVLELKKANQYCVRKRVKTNVWYVQLKSDQTAQLLNEPNVNEVILRGQKLPLKCCQTL